MRLPRVTVALAAPSGAIGGGAAASEAGAGVEGGADAEVGGVSGAGGYAGGGAAGAPAVVPLEGEALGTFGELGPLEGKG